MAQIRSPFELPDYVTALEQEHLRRVISFHPVPDIIAGFTVLPMTLRHYSILRLANSPFLPPFGTPTPQQLIQFLWVLNPAFITQADKDKNEFFDRAKKLFIPPAPPRWKNIIVRNLWFRRRLDCQLREASAVDAIRKFSEATMADRQAGSGAYSPDYYSDECSIVGTLASNFKWGEDAILSMPLTRIFQYLNYIRERDAQENGQPPLISNGSDEIIQKHLAEANRTN